jgi:hypothetical protein
LAGVTNSSEAELWLVNTQSLFVKYGATNGVFRMRVACPSAGNHVLEAATNVTGNWIALATNASPFGILDFVDSSATNFAQRFYRARTE